MAADRPTDPFSAKLQSCLPLVAPSLQYAVLDYERLRSHIKRIAFYTAPDEEPQTAQSSQSSHLLPPTSDDRRSGRHHGQAGGGKERAKRHHELFWSELRRQVEVMNTAYGREEKECRRLLAELNSSEAAQQQRTAEVCRYLAQHCSSPNAATPIRPPTSTDLLTTFQSALRLCSSLSALSHFLFVSYLVLWRAVGKYNKHTESSVDQRQLAAFPSSPFTAPPRLSSLLSKANALFALQSSVSNTGSAASHCPLCLLDSPHLLHLQCHSLCFSCCVRQPSFGLHCPQCRREEDVQLDSVEVGQWVSSICRLRVDDSSASMVKLEPSYSRAAEMDMNDTTKQEADEEKSGKRSGRLKERKLTVKVGDVELAAFPASLPLTFPASPLSACSNSSDASYLSSPSTASLSVPAGPPHLPPSPGPNASPTSSSAFDEFFALHFRPKRGQGVSCHQCKTNKDPATLLFCANREEKGVRRRRCRKKYCESCLRRSYPLHVLVREDGRDWHCPSCVGVCCCAACQRKESPASTTGSDENKAADSPPVISLSRSSSATQRLPSSSRVRRDTSDSGRPEKRLKRESSSNSSHNQLALTSPIRLSFSSSSPPLSYFHQTMPSLEPLSSPISPDSISHSLTQSSPGFSSVPDQPPPPGIEEWERVLISTMPASSASLPPSTAVHHAHVRPLMPPPPANSLLAAINAPAGLLHPMHQELDSRRANSAPPDAIRRAQRQSQSGLSLPPALPTMAHDGLLPLHVDPHNPSSRSSLSLPSGQSFDLHNPYTLSHSHSQPLPPHHYSTGTNSSSPTAAYYNNHGRSTSLDFSAMSGDSFLSIQSLSSSPTQQMGGAHYSFPDLPLSTVPASHQYGSEVDGSGGLKSGAGSRTDEQLWSAVDELFAP